MIKKILLSLVATFLLGLLAWNASLSAKPASATEVDNCEYSCPVIHFEWDTQTEEEGHYVYADKIQVVDVAGHYECPSGYTEGTQSSYPQHYCKHGSTKYNFDDKKVWIPSTYKDDCPSGYELHGGTCRKWVEGGTQTVHHSADVAYDKSNDPHKCHRPSDDTLTDVYGLDHDARLQFKNLHEEWLDSSKPDNDSCNESSPSPSPSVSPSPTINPCDGECQSPTPTPTPTPTPGGTSGPTSCSATKPGNTSILSVVRNGTDSVNVTWTKADYADHYILSYGLGSGNYTYGIPDTGNVTSVTVGGLDLNKTYCFQIRAGNSCAPGDPSNEACTALGGPAYQRGPAVLGLSNTSSSQPVSTPVALGLSTIFLFSGYKLLRRNA